MHERLSLVALDPVRQGERVVIDVALEQDVSAVCPTHADDRFRYSTRHDHGGWCAERRCGERDALRVTAGRRRDDSSLPRRVVEGCDLVEGASYFEGTRWLECLDLEVDLGSEVGREQRRALKRSAREEAVHDPACGDHIRDGRLSLHGATILRPEAAAL